MPTYRRALHRGPCRNPGTERALQDVAHQLTGPLVDRSLFHLDNARRELTASIQRLTETGADAVGDIVSIDPIDALATKVKAVEVTTTNLPDFLGPPRYRYGEAETEVGQQAS